MSGVCYIMPASVKRCEDLISCVSQRHIGTVRLPKDSKERVPAFKILRERYEFKDSAIQSYGIKTKNACHIGHHLDAHTTQKVASRAFDAVSKYAFGKKGRPRFKGKGQFDSLEGKTNASGIRYREGWLEWRGLGIQCLIPQSDEVIAYGLSHRIKFCRLVRRKIKGKSSFYVQLVVEGLPRRIGQGLKLSVSTADLRLSPTSEKLRLISSSSVLSWSPSRRKSVYCNASSTGSAGPTIPATITRPVIKKGAKRWVLSVGYKETRAELTLFSTGMPNTGSLSTESLPTRSFGLVRTSTLKIIRTSRFRRTSARALASVRRGCLSLD